MPVRHHASQFSLAARPAIQTAAAGLLALAAGCAEHASTTPQGSPVNVEKASIIQLPASSDRGADSLGGFTDIRGLGFDGRGRIVVTDASINRVLIFDTLGNPQYGFGQGGAGPGDLRSPCCIRITDDGHLWVEEDGNQRYSEFALGDSSAIYVKSVAMPDGPTGLSTRISFAGGKLMHNGAAGMKSDGAFQIARFLREPSGRWKSVDTLTERSPDSLGAAVSRSGNGMSVFRLPFAPQTLWAFGIGDAYATAVSSSYDVSVYGPGHVLRWSARRTLPPSALSDEQRQRAATIRTAIAKRHPDIADQLKLPQERPQIENLCVDLDGNLWIQFVSPEPGLRYADVYDSSGHLKATKSWPDNIELTKCAATGERALGVATDSVGLQHVVLMRFNSPPVSP